MRSLDDGREAVGPVVAVARETANARAIPATINRYPSCLISRTQSGPDGGRTAFDGRQGSMKLEEKTIRTCGKKEAVIVGSVQAKAG